MLKLLTVVFVTVTLSSVSGQLPATGATPLRDNSQPPDSFPLDLYGEGPFNNPTESVPTSQLSMESTEVATQSTGTTPAPVLKTETAATVKAQNVTSDKFDPNVMPPEQFFKFLAQTHKPTTESSETTSPSSGANGKLDPDVIPPAKFFDLLVGNTQGKTTATTNKPTEKFDPDVMPPSKFFEWLSENGQTVQPSTGISLVTEGKIETANGNQKFDPFDPDVLPPKKFMEWLQSNQPVEKFIEVKKETAMEPEGVFLSKQMIIIIATASGTAFLCAIVLTAICCYRRAVNKKEAKIKADSPIHDQSKPDVYVMRKQDPNMFMGIPANNDIWKDLQNLPETASVVIPEGGKA